MPASWKMPVIDTELEYSYAPVADIHSFNPLNTFIERPTGGKSREKSTIIVQIARGITRIPVYNSVKGVDNIVELHSVETQTEELSVHGLTELIDREYRRWRRHRGECCLRESSCY